MLQSLASYFESWCLILSHSAQLTDRSPALPFLMTVTKGGDYKVDIITSMSLSSYDFLVLLWSAGIEDVKQVSREVLSILLFFFLLTPLKVTYQAW